MELMIYSYWTACNWYLFGGKAENPRAVGLHKVGPSAIWHVLFRTTPVCMVLFLFAQMAEVWAQASLRSFCKSIFVNCPEPAIVPAHTDAVMAGDAFVGIRFAANTTNGPDANMTGYNSNRIV